MAVGIVGIGAGVVALRAATQSTHHLTHPHSQMAFTVDASVNRNDARDSVEEMASALLDYCRMEVGSDAVGDVEPLPGPSTRFRYVLQPEPDVTGRLQFEGCVEDWQMDHVQLRIVSSERSGPGS